MKRIISLIGLTLACSWILPVFAGDSPQFKHVQQGILPNGGYYNVYTFSCSDHQADQAVVRMQQSQWCSQLDGGVYCRRKPSSVAQRVCSSGPLRQLAAHP